MRIKEHQLRDWAGVGSLETPAQARRVLTAVQCWYRVFTQALVSLYHGHTSGIYETFCSALIKTVKVTEDTFNS